MDNYENMIKTICRLCFTQNTSEKMVSLIDNTTDSGLSCFGTAVTKICNISIQKDDKLVTMMCEKCVYFLKQAIYFKLKCETSDKQLKQLVKLNVNNDTSEQDIAKIVCEFVMFNHYFPVERHSKPSKSKKKSMTEVRSGKFGYKNHQKISVENVENNANLGDKMYEFDDYIDIQDSDDRFNDKLEEYSKEADYILDCMQEIIKAEANVIPYKSCLKRKLKRQKYIALTNKSEKTNRTNKIHQNYRRREQYHTKTVKDERNLICNICHKTLANRYTYSCHMQRHSNFKYMCDQCGKGFPVLSEMQMHQIARHGVGPYLQCDHCPYKAPRKLSLIEHLRIHTGERPFTCEKCGLTFRRKAIWRNHLVCHMEKKIQCLYCPRKFYRQGSMLAHCNNVHERLYMFMCSVCNVTYTKTETVRRHMLVKHGIPREKQGKILRVMNNTSDFTEKV